MCGGAIISDFVPPSRTARRVNAADLLWNPHVKSEIGRNDYYSKPLVSDFDDDFEADFQGFKDDDESFSFPAAKPRGASSSMASSRWFNRTQMVQSDGTKRKIKQIWV